MNTYVKLGALSQAALEALVAGTGIAIFFGLGLRGLALWAGDEGGAGAEARDGAAALGTGGRNPAGLALAVLSFAVVVAIVGTGLYVMLASK